MRYKDAGVDFGAARRAKSKIKKLAQSTLNPRVLGGTGGFGGFYALRGMTRDAVLVASMDGVGTKLKIAFEMNQHGTVGADLVNHCVNDIAVHGARPLFFLDYLATGRLQPKIAAEIVAGIARACREADCALIGGETAEMPGFYPDAEYDLAGCIVGWAPRARIVDGARIRPGDSILALPSLGLHTNGYSLARKVLLESAGMKLDQRVPELGRTLGEELLAPHRCYGPLLWPLLAKDWVNGLAHITGGGITDNLPRILPAGCQACIALGSWPVPPIFELIARLGRIPRGEMLRTFNVGAGMILIVSPERLKQVVEYLRKRGESLSLVGGVERGQRTVKYIKRVRGGAAFPVS
ncbi:MAG: phosphoribosylformylglycinamidine cyclo-ligase [Terriglobia bacterium]